MLLTHMPDERTMHSQDADRREIKMDANTPLLEIKGLKTYFFLDEGTVKAVEGADLIIPRRATVGVVGESGCGKSVTAYSILQLVEHPGRIVEGQVIWHREKSDSAEEIDLARLRPNSREMRAIRGGEISMIFQEPLSSLSPVHTVGNQISEAISLHRAISRHEVQQQVIELLHRVGIPRPEERIDAYPFQLSGGMRQRVMIAMALSCHPSLLIADEPTTALDVTTQAQILELISELQQDYGMSVLLITHNLGVVAETSDQVVVMYLGEVVEQADTVSLFNSPQHPYTQALLRSIPKLGQRNRGRIEAIKGMVPDPYNRPQGCAFHPRCIHGMPGVCDQIRPSLTRLPSGATVRCHLYEGEHDGQ
jgi:peptide/nickel transport system ATP-binding protein